MKEWLLKEEKAKVGRPKLADNSILNKAKASIAISSLTCIFMIFMFICIIKQISPLEYAYSLTLEKLVGTPKYFNNFVLEEKYDSNNDYIMILKPSDKVKTYQGNYKYVLYKLDGSNWKEVDEKQLDKKVKNIKIKINSKRNQNETYKINLYLLNASKIDKSFAPYGWTFVDSSKQDEKYAYKVFTVKGYYSPILKDEVKEANKKNKTKVTVLTSKENPREFIINVPDTSYNINVSYTDEQGKKITLKKENNLSGKVKFNVPNVKKISNVTIKVWVDDAEKYKLSNWEIKKDKSGNDYITNTYLLKPEVISGN